MHDIDVVIVGRFPPPVDGQSLLTERLAKILSDSFRTTVVNTNTDKKGLSKVDHYRRKGLELESEIDSASSPIVVWPSISPHPVSHFRDLSTVINRCRSSSIIAVIHWGNFDKLFTSLLSKFSAQRVVNRISRFVFLDHKLEGACSRWIPEHKSVTISNALDSEVINSAEDVLERIHSGPSIPFRILYLSNMIRTKGYLDVLQATRILVESGENVITEFVGAWHESRLSFDEEVVDGGLGKHVIHHGQISDRKVIRELMLAADAFILPTYYPTEAQPSALIEALSAGTPVITCDQGGIGEMVRAGHDAMIVPSRSPDEIASRVVQLMQPDTWSKFATNARIRFESHFNVERIQQQWIDLINQVADETG